jgi:anti-sigma B factor antagonist
MVQYFSQPECTIVELGPSYDSLDVDALDEAGSVLLTQAAIAEPPRLIIDLSQTAFVGSTFIELLVRTWKLLGQRGGRMALCGLHPFCIDVFRVTRLETLWDVYATRNDAVRAITA